MKRILRLNDYLKFLPLLLFYLIVCTLKAQDFFDGDEGRYVKYADNLLSGFYADASSAYTFLWNGPGYPIFLMIFRFFKIPLIIAKLFNGAFIYMGIIYLYKILKVLLCEKKAFLISISLGLYYPFLFQAIPILLTEALSFFLISVFIYNLYKYITYNSKKNKWLAAFFLAYLILTKVFFAYVIIALLLILFPFIFQKKASKCVKKYITTLLMALFFTTPYLSYTYAKTGKTLYYSNSGGMSLYWMSTPYSGEYGDWHLFETLNKKPKIYVNHSKFINSLKNLSPVEKDTALKKKAIKNIINNKYSFFKNWASNLGRLFFHFPYTNPLIKPSFRILFIVFTGTILVISLLITSFLSIKFLKKLNPIIYFISAFIFVYIGGISMLSSYPRFLHIILPFVFIWVSYIFNQFLIIKIKPSK